MGKMGIVLIIHVKNLILSFGSVGEEEKKMKDFPGTLMSLIPRFMQCVFAAASFASLSPSSSFFDITAFWYLIASMCLQMFWSFLLALFDAYSLVKKKAFHDQLVVSFFLVGDWCTATLSLSAASASAGITVFFSDLSYCRLGEECRNARLLLLMLT